MFEAGGSQDVVLIAGGFQAPETIGYHRLEIGHVCLDLLISPSRCVTPMRRGWGPAIQIPSLAGPGAYGTFREMAEAARQFAQAGAEFVALSPYYARRPSQDGFSPYSPSSRIFLNEALGVTVPEMGPPGALIDWPEAHARVHGILAAYVRDLTDAERRDFLEWRHLQGDAHRFHAAYNILARRYGCPKTFPTHLRAANERSVAEILQALPDEFETELYGQYLAQRGLAQTQAAARSRGANIGLIADLPIGVDPEGSDVWTSPGAFLNGLTIGAPPDPMGPTGQNWGLTTFSPSSLIAQGFRPFVEMIQTAFRHSGAIRIDHAFGLQRLWVVPHGRPSSTGAYLSYPLEDLMRIIALESHRHQAPVIAEDLGTLPPGFRLHMESRGLLGMKVLWFERDDDGGFRSATDLPPASATLSSTHDTATVAGWWRGVDLDWRGRTEPSFHPAESRRNRDLERQALWKRIGTGVVPAEDATDDVVDAAIDHISEASSSLLIVPMEDLLGLCDAVNIPGTTNEHPNWRRRLPATIDVLLGSERINGRLQRLNNSRPPGVFENEGVRQHPVLPLPSRSQI